MARVVHLSGPGLVANNHGVGSTLSVLGQRRGKLFSVLATNALDATLYLQAFDSAGGVAAGTIPVASVPVPPGEAGSLDWSGGRPFALGIFVAFSAQLLTYATVAGDTLIDSCYETD